MVRGVGREGSGAVVLASDWLCACRWAVRLHPLMHHTSLPACLACRPAPVPCPAGEVELRHEDVIPNSQSLVVYSRRGYIKRMRADTFGVQKLRGKGGCWCDFLPGCGRLRVLGARWRAEAALQGG